MATVKDHYDGHLGKVYSWMAGDFEALKRRHAELFARLELDSDIASSAVDLGAGHGAQAAALAERGFRVIAIDFCRALLDELRANTAGLRVTPVEDDLIEFRKHLPSRAGAIVCMGDTLAHLPSKDDAERLIRDVAEALTPGGKFVATFRDYVSREARGEARFIPVKADANLILTCFLDYESDAVTVYDLLHRRTDGGWKQEVSSYRKLRLDPDWLAGICEGEGLEPVERTSNAGMITFVAVRSATRRSTKTAVR